MIDDGAIKLGVRTGRLTDGEGGNAQRRGRRSGREEQRFHTRVPTSVSAMDHLVGSVGQRTRDDEVEALVRLAAKRVGGRPLRIGETGRPEEDVHGAVFAGRRAVESHQRVERRRDHRVLPRHQRAHRVRHDCGRHLCGVEAFLDRDLDRVGAFVHRCPRERVVEAEVSYDGEKGKPVRCIRDLELINGSRPAVRGRRRPDDPLPDELRGRHTRLQ